MENINSHQKEGADTKKYDLSYTGIQAVCDEVGAFLSLRGTSKQEKLKVSFMLEEALLDYREHLPDNAAVTLRTYAILGTIRAIVTVEGERFDPFEAEGRSDKSIMGVLMAGEDAARASWKYKEPYNEIVFTARRQRRISSIAHIGLGLLCGIALGCAMLLLPEETAQNIVSGYITPVTSAFTGLLCVMAAPMCFFAIVLGIVRAGDISAVSNMAKKTVGHLALLSLLIAMFGVLGATSRLYFGSGVFSLSSLHKLFEILLSFVPANILSPMLNFNSVQIIIIGVMLGASLLAIGQKGENVIELFDTLNDAAVNCNVVYLNRFIPYYLALTVLGIIGARQIAVAPGFLRLALDVLIGETLILAFCTTAVRIRLGVSLRVLFRKMAPPFMIALSTASFGASFVENINSLLALGVESKYAALGYNIGGVMFRPGECVILTASSLYMAYLFGVEVSWVWITTVFLLAFILSIATPPVPGGTAVSLAILFSQIDFPDQALTLILPLSMMLEFPTVAIDAFCAKSQVLLMARASGALDLKKARQE